MEVCSSGEQQHQPRQQQSAQQASNSPGEAKQGEDIDVAEVEEVVPDGKEVEEEAVVSFTNQTFLYHLEHIML